MTPFFIIFRRYVHGTDKSEGKFYRKEKKKETIAEGKNSEKLSSTNKVIKWNRNGLKIFRYIIPYNEVSNTEEIRSS